MASRFASPYFTVLDSSGVPVPGAKANFYETGTTTRLNTYTTEDLVTANANPVVADSAGRLPAIWLLNQDYKLVLTDSADVEITTIDPVQGVLTIRADDFKVSEQSTPDMTVQASAGSLFDLVTKARIVKTAQNTGTITAPSSNPRNDIVYVDLSTGVIGVETGAEAGSPTDPTIPDNKLPLARLRLATSTTSITSSLIDDIRELANIGYGAPTTVDIQTFTASGTWTKPAGASRLLVRVWGAGGGGSTSGGGGGGGAYNEVFLAASAAGATETVTIGGGGAAETDGGNTTFGSLVTGYGGEAGTTVGGGGGGVLSKGGGSTGGSPAGGGAGADSGFGGAGGGNTTAGGDSAYGGGGGGDATSQTGGDSLFGGGGGGGSPAGAAGTSVFGGNGGAGGSNNGTQPGGGGGADSTTPGEGADGQIIVITWVTT